MIRRPLDFTGLTSRSAALLVQTACRYDARILVEQGSKVINAKSLMGVLSLSAMAQDSAVCLVLDGHDELEACQAITDLVAGSFTATA